jgi:hypothetical protein
MIFSIATIPKTGYEMFFAIMSSSFVGMTMQSRPEPEVIRPLLCLPFCSCFTFSRSLSFR